MDIIGRREVERGDWFYLIVAHRFLNEIRSHLISIFVRDSAHIHSFEKLHWTVIGTIVWIHRKLLWLRNECCLRRISWHVMNQ